MEATGLDQLTESEADLLLGIEPSSSSPGDSLRRGHPGLWPRPEASGGEHTRHARRGREPLRQPGGLRLRRLVAALDEPAVRLQISRGPKDAFGELNDPARILTIVNEGLPEDDPVAYAFMDALKLDEDQLNDLESTINEAGDPLEGGRRTNAASGSPGSRPPRTRASLEKGPAHYAKLRGNGECSVPAWHVTHLLVRERISAGGHRR
jgi:hypothetical protein